MLTVDEKYLFKELIRLGFYAMFTGSQEYAQQFEEIEKILLQKYTREEILEIARGILGEPVDEEKQKRIAMLRQKLNYLRALVATGEKHYMKELKKIEEQIKKLSL